ncbi:MAG: hypothetical protein RIQ34_268 [Bacteroidota bacterium]|jgi:hypothetical protein
MKILSPRRIAVLLSGIILSLSSAEVSAQVKVGDNSRSLNPDAVLELESTGKGLLLPRISLRSTTQSDPLRTFTSGMMVYNTANVNDVSPGIYFSDGLKWIRANGNSGGGPFLTGTQQVIQIVSANGQLLFPTPAAVTDPNKVFLFRNGVLISFVLRNPTTLQAEIPCQAGDQIKIIQFL